MLCYKNGEFENTIAAEILYDGQNIEKVVNECWNNSREASSPSHIWLPV